MSWVLELISSDQIALYELVKNAVDAGSPKIEVRFRIGLTRSAFDLVLSQLESHEGAITPELFEDLSVHLTALSDEHLEEVTTNLPGLDAEAAALWFKDFYKAISYIEVEDWGHGME